MVAHKDGMVLQVEDVGNPGGGGSCGEAGRRGREVHVGGGSWSGKGVDVEVGAERMAGVSRGVGNPGPAVAQLETKVAEAVSRLRVLHCLPVDVTVIEVVCQQLEQRVVDLAHKRVARQVDDCKMG